MTSFSGPEKNRSDSNRCDCSCDFYTHSSLTWWTFRILLSNSLPCTASLAQVKRGCLSSYSESSSCRLIRCRCHMSHAQMHDDFKDRNPVPYSGLVSFISGSGHVHILWTFRHIFRHGSRAGQGQNTKYQEDNQVNDKDDNHIIIRREKDVHMESQSLRRSGHQHVCS